MNKDLEKRQTDRQTGCCGAEGTEARLKKAAGVFKTDVAWLSESREDVIAGYRNVPCSYH